jgi:hypothetical protein
LSELRFLSEEWLAALGDLVAAAASAPDGDRAEDGPEGSDRTDEPPPGGTTTATGASAGPLRLGQLVTGGPDGDVAYTVVLGGEGPGVVAGADGAGVVLVESFETARAIASGQVTAGEAVARGLIKVRGNANLLIGAAPLLAGVAEAVTALRARTTF